jgi:hypothetical protein
MGTPPQWAIDSRPKASFAKVLAEHPAGSVKRGKSLRVSKFQVRKANEKQKNKLSKDCVGTCHRRHFGQVCIWRQA